MCDVSNDVLTGVYAIDRQEQSTPYRHSFPMAERHATTSVRSAAEAEVASRRRGARIGR
jgi:hypothetical protein